MSDICHYRADGRGVQYSNEGANIDGLIFVLNFANDDGNNNSMYHEQSTHGVTLGTQCLI